MPCCSQQISGKNSESKTTLSWKSFPKICQLESTLNSRSRYSRIKLTYTTWKLREARSYSWLQGRNNLTPYKKLYTVYVYNIQVWIYLHYLSLFILTDLLFCFEALFSWSCRSLCVVSVWSPHVHTWGITTSSRLTRVIHFNK